MRPLDYPLFPFAVVGAFVMSLPILCAMLIGWTLDTIAYGEYFGTGR